MLSHGYGGLKKKKNMITVAQTVDVGIFNIGEGGAEFGCNRSSLGFFSFCPQHFLTTPGGGDSNPGPEQCSPSLDFRQFLANFQSQENEMGLNGVKQTVMCTSSQRRGSTCLHHNVAGQAVLLRGWKPCSRSSDCRGPAG